MIPRTSLSAVVAALSVIGLVGVGHDEPTSGSAGSPAHRSTLTSQRAEGAATEATVTVVAVGDIACLPGQARTTTRCRQADTAALTRRLDPDAVLALGDLQYEDGRLSDFRQSYDDSWGRLKRRTHPLPGNHEYNTRGAAGYYRYFARRQPGAPGYYLRTLGAWKVYLLNSNCSKIDCRREHRWLRRALDANPGQCSLFALHHPRYSSGEHGSQAGMRRFFAIADNHGVEMILSGHDHHYERFARMDADGQLRKRGVIQFVSGAGGKSHYSVTGRARGSRFVDDDTYGVLRLTLAPRSYGWAYTTVAGATPDTGSRSCS